MALPASQYYDRGSEKLHGGEAEAALGFFEQAVAVEPANAGYRAAMGVALFSLGRYPEAERALRKSVHLDKRGVEARGNLALVLEQQGKLTEALEQYSLALESDPTYDGARVNRGALLMDMGRYRDAFANNSILVERQPAWPMAHFNLGDTLLALGEWEDALVSFDRALTLEPDYTKAQFNRAVALAMLGEFEVAAEEFDAARRADEPVYRQCLKNVGWVFGYDDSLEDLSPQLIYLIGMYQRQEVCDWRRRREYVEHFREWIEKRKPFMNDQALAFRALSLPLDSLHQSDMSRMISARQAEAVGLPLPSRLPEKRAKLRIAYLSPDFRFHPTARLTRQLFHLHDRERFEIYAYSLLPDDGSVLRRDIRTACDRFVDVDDLNAKELADRIRADEIDILVDMAGHTRGNRLDVFALRPVPVQVAYLAFPNTTGADFMDYLVTDAVTSPSGTDAWYSERLVRLPRAYLCYDNEQAVASSPTRLDVGLPDLGTVFCCFNNPYKIGPEIFSCWMRILERVPGSVLWLFQGKEGVESNLRREAARLGIDPARLVFASFIPDPAKHLARYRLADLFLDTPICNAHTTAADALWAGLPVLTCPGESHWSRVAASLLVSVGMAELAAESLDAYVETAVRLGSHPEEVTALKAKLAINRDRWPLFDTQGYVSYLERAYLTMWERHVAGLPPESFNVPA